MVAAGSMAWRRGEVERADSLFRAGIPRLPKEVRALFDDVTPLASAGEAEQLSSLAAAARDEFLRRFWARFDPDPTTPENEAQLEFWSRETHAYLLFREP